MIPIDTSARTIVIHMQHGAADGVRAGAAASIRALITACRSQPRCVSTACFWRSASLTQHTLRTGSTALRVGRASAEAPLEVAHVVAYRRTGGETQSAAAARPLEVTPPAPVDDELEATCRQVRAVHACVFPCEQAALL